MFLGSPEMEITDRTRYQSEKFCWYRGREGSRPEISRLKYSINVGEDREKQRIEEEAWSERSFDSMDKWIVWIVWICGGEGEEEEEEWEDGRNGRDGREWME
jgi:hypothetical protein